ncbi:hypothetical protein JCM5353_004534 [Sporobolomyces roseus]
MPIPSLPIELVRGIVSHLRTPLESDTHEAIEAGQALSLVCRGWYPIGQALRWKDLRIDIASVLSLLAHFDLHPHLPHYTQYLAQSTYANSGEEDTPTTEGFSALPRLLTTLQELRSLYLSDVHLGLEPIFHAAADLPHLLHFICLVEQDLTWNNSFNTAFAQGFPSLRRFSFMTTRNLLSAVGTTYKPDSSPVKQLEYLALSWGSFSTTDLIQSILSTMDLAALRSCFLANGPAIIFPFGALSSFPNLETLTISVIEFSVASNFPALLSNLSKATSLKTLQYQIIPNKTLYASPLTLDAVFASFPSTLRLLQAPQLLLTKSDLSQDWPLASRESRDGLCAVQGLIATSEGTRCVVFWRERGSKEKKGYHRILEYTSWDEFKARYADHLSHKAEEAHSVSRLCRTSGST